MKSRIVFFLSLTAFLNPISVFAIESRDAKELGVKIACQKKAMKALLKEHDELKEKDVKQLISESKKAVPST